MVRLVRATTSFAFVLLAALSWVPASSATLLFNLTPEPSMNPLASAGFQSAANLWASLLVDAVTVNISVNFTNLAPGTLGQSSQKDSTFDYATVKSAMAAHAKSSSDQSALASLPASSIPLYINGTSDDPNGSGSPIPYLDDNGGPNNTTVRITTANQKALGLLAANAAGFDASITFNSDFDFDFDPADGINAGAFDFVGIATHEIGHALGFLSGVDVLDTSWSGTNDPFPADYYTVVTILDLFRYSTDSVAALPGARDWSADSRDKYLSIDGGKTALAQFSTGRILGDGRQASHWKDNLGTGVMDPTAAPGELLSISAADVQSLDVIGWDLAETPEPATIALCATGMAVLFLGLRKRSPAFPAMQPEVRTGRSS